MPSYRNRTVFEIARGSKAFLNLEVGVTRGEAPGFGNPPPGEGRGQVENQRQRIEHLRERLSDKDRKLKESREELAGKNEELVKLHIKLAERDHFTFRPGTFDEGVFLTVNMQNEYRLPDSFAPDDVIVDVGTHIGSFCYAALRRGSRNVYGFEAERSNYERASENLRPFGGRVRLRNKAVWRSDEPVEKLFFTPSTDETNTAGGNVVEASVGEEVEAVAFDEVIREATDGGRKRVKLLKMDCEGSEFPILLTSQSLHLIDNIRGEFHEFDEGQSLPENVRVPGYERFTLTELTDALQSAGFTVTSERHEGTGLGLFFAAREQRLEGTMDGQGRGV